MKEKRKSCGNIVVALLLVAVACYFLFIECNRLPERAQLYPKVIFGIFLTLAVALLVQSILQAFSVIKAPEKKTGVPLDIFKYPLVMAMISAVYVVLFRVVGVYIATALFAVAMMFYYGERRLLPILLTAAGLDLFIYVIFQMLFKVRFMSLLF